MDQWGLGPYITKRAFQTKRTGRLNEREAKQSKTQPASTGHTPRWVKCMAVMRGRDMRRTERKALMHNEKAPATVQPRRYNKATRSTPRFARLVRYARPGCALSSRGEVNAQRLSSTRVTRSRQTCTAGKACEGGSVSITFQPLCRCDTARVEESAALCSLWKPPSGFFGRLGAPKEDILRLLRRFVRQTGTQPFPSRRDDLAADGLTRPRCHPGGETWLSVKAAPPSRIKSLSHVIGWTWGRKTPSTIRAPRR